MKGHHYRSLAIAAVAGLLLTACGGGEAASDAGAEGGEEASTDEGEDITLTFWDNQQADSGLSEFQQTAIEEFEEENPNINIEVETVPYDDYQQRLTLAVEGGNPPDVATLDQIWQGQFSDAGAIVPLGDYVTDSESVAEENYFPGAWDSAMWDDELFGIPFNVDVWQFTYYNEELLDEAGVDPVQLETWDGLREAGEALTTEGQYGIGLFGQAYETLTVVMNSFVFSNGGEILAEDGTCRLDEPEAVEALEYLDSLQEYAPEGLLSASNEDMRELFLNETLATEWWGAFEQPTLQESDLDWGFTVGTAPEGQEPIGVYGGWNLAIFEGTEHADAAWEFIEFLTDPEVNPRVVDLIPANVEAAETFLPENRENPELVMEHLENARPRPLAVNYLQIAEVQVDMMQRIFDGTDAQDAATDACEEINDLT